VDQGQLLDDIPFKNVRAVCRPMLDQVIHYARDPRNQTLGRWTGDNIGTV